MPDFAITPGRPRMPAPIMQPISVATAENTLFFDIGFFILKKAFIVLLLEELTQSLLPSLS